MATSGKFSQLRPIENEVLDDYLNNDLTIAEIALKYNSHYSNMRRFIKQLLVENNLETQLNVQYINVEDFKWLEIGDTFQYADWLTVWRVTKITDKENQSVFELCPSTTKNANRHWLVGENC